MPPNTQPARLPAEFLRVGEPSPFTLRNRAGAVVVPRGTLIDNEIQRQKLLDIGVFLDRHDHEVLQRAMAGKVATMVHANALIGQIASARPDAADFAAAGGKSAARRLQDPVNSWSGVHLRLRALLLDTGAPEFVSRLDDLQRRVAELLQSDPDDSLLTLLYPAARALQDYSPTHATLVAVICHLATRHLPDWDNAWDAPLRTTALVMNVAISVLQNKLALQTTPLTDEQRRLIDGHAAEGAALLRQAGVRDELVLEAVAAHHAAPPGPLAALPPALRIARVVQRADRFCAQLSPRKSRPAQSAHAAGRSAYLDEHGQPDPTGSAILKAVGLYPAGSVVRLRSGETGVVLRRGRAANTPVVAAVVNASGLPMGDPLVRRDGLPTHEVVAALAPDSVKVLLGLERLLALQ